MYPARSIASVVVSIIATLVVFRDCAHSQSTNNVLDTSTRLTHKLRTPWTITVNGNGQGNFKTIQEAIDRVPDGNSNWITIFIKKGIYREKVSIPRNKPYIFLKGEGRGNTFIVSSRNSTKSYESSTFIVEAPHFVAYGISFKNTAPMGSTHTPQSHAVATLVGSDKAAFYDCGFFSKHNTLFDYKGRHYYDNCYIQGSIDFIYGQGQAIFHDCELFVLPNLRADIRGSIASHHRPSKNESTGFVFLKGKVYGIGVDDVYLGRAKGAHSRVVFAKTYLSNAVHFRGWTDWNYLGSKENLYHAEYKCHGPGSTSGNRAHWSKQLRREEVAPFLSIDFVHGKEWVPVSTLMAE